MTKELEEARARLEKVAAGERLSAVYWLPGKAVRPDFAADLRLLLSAWNTRPDEGEPVAWRWRAIHDDGSEGSWVYETGPLSRDIHTRLRLEHQPLYTRPAPALDREGVKTALQSSRGWPADLHPGPAADAILAMVGGGVPAGWQDATTAPKDGTPFMVWAPGFEWPEIVKWQAYSVEDAEEVGEPGYWTYAEEMLANVVDSVEADQWTHWSPLPASPVEG